MKTKVTKAAGFLRTLLPKFADYKAMTRSPVRDLMAGVTVAIVALPLALAFGVASGLGASAGLATAIIAGIVAAIFGGSNLQISGPTGAMTVVLVPVFHRFGVDGVLQVGIMAGLLLVLLAITGVGRYVRLLPHSLIEGFTAGIAVVIALQQLPNILGVSSSDKEQVLAVAWDSIVAFGKNPNPIPLIIALTVAGLILVSAKLKPGLPMSLVAIAVITFAVWYFKFDVPIIGELPSSLAAPTFEFFDWSRLSELFPSAAAVAALAAIESLLCATVADAMSVDEHHNPDRELFGQGLANLAAPIFGGVPATAAIARTAVNVRAGARSRLSAITHSLILLAIVFTIAPLVGIIPLAALGGVLLATTIQMVNISTLWTLFRATRGDGIVLVTTFVVTVAVDLITAVVLGFGVAGLLALRAVAKSAQLERMELPAPSYHGSEPEWLEEQKLLDEHIIAYRLDGPLFFGAAHRFLLELTNVSDAAVVILRLSRLSTLDATGAKVLDDAVMQLEKRNITVLISGVKPGHSKVLRRMGTAQNLRAIGQVFAETPEAIQYARKLMAERQAES